MIPPSPSLTASKWPTSLGTAIPVAKYDNSLLGSITSGPIDYGNTLVMRQAYWAMYDAYPVSTAELRLTLTAYLERNGKSPNEIQRQLSLLGLLPDSGAPDA